MTATNASLLRTQISTRHSAYRSRVILQEQRLLEDVLTLLPTKLRDNSSYLLEEKSNTFQSNNHYSGISQRKFSKVNQNWHNDFGFNKIQTKTKGAIIRCSIFLVHNLLFNSSLLPEVTVFKVHAVRHWAL